MASYFLCHDAIISFAELSLSLLFLFCFSTQNRFFLPRAAGEAGRRRSTPSPGRDDATRVPPRPPAAGARPGPQLPGDPDPSSPADPGRRAGDRAVAHGPWPTGRGPRAAQALQRSPSPAGPPRPVPPPAAPRPSPAGSWGAGEGLSVSKVSKFKLAFLPRLAPATCATRANSEGKQKLSKVSHKCQCF